MGRLEQHAAPARPHTEGPRAGPGKGLERGRRRHGPHCDQQDERLRPGRRWRCGARASLHPAPIGSLLAGARAIHRVTPLWRELLVADSASLLRDHLRQVLLPGLELLPGVGVVDGDPALVAADEIERAALAINKNRPPATVTRLGRRPTTGEPTTFLASGAGRHDARASPTDDDAIDRLVLGQLALADRTVHALPIA